MCELFAVSSKVPTNVSFSLEEFSRHGGGTAHHKDGWGLAFYDGSWFLEKKNQLPTVNGWHFTQSPT